MNTHFNSALKQSASIRKDLCLLSTSPLTAPASLTGQLQASLTSFSRTIDDYAATASRELVIAKQEKAYERIKNFRQELAEYRDQFASLKREREEQQTQGNRNELLGRRPYGGTSTPENPYANNSVAAQNQSVNSPWAPRPGSGGASGSGGLGMGGNDYTRETHALREQTFFQNTHSALDDYLARGQAVLGELADNREMLKGTQKRLYSVANTLGISGDTIRMVERRAKQDKYIFGVGVVVFFLFCWLVLHYLR